VTLGSFWSQLNLSSYFIISPLYSLHCELFHSERTKSIRCLYQNLRSSDALSTRQITSPFLSSPQVNLNFVRNDNKTPAEALGDLLSYCCGQCFLRKWSKHLQWVSERLSWEFFVIVDHVIKFYAASISLLCSLSSTKAYYDVTPSFSEAVLSNHDTSYFRHRLFSFLFL